MLDLIGKVLLKMHGFILSLTVFVQVLRWKLRKDKGNQNTSLQGADKPVGTTETYG